MTAERWRQIGRLYSGALAHEGNARVAFLADACRGDATLLRELESLLEHATASFSGLDTIVFDAPSTASLDHFTGTLIAARYRVGDRIAEGGMGVVYRALDEQMQRPVAIKFLPPSLSQAGDRLKRFGTEARVLAALNHPHIVTVYEVGEAEGIPFLAMELVDGITLRDRVRDGPMPLREALGVAHQVAVAVAAAHGEGIIHRDLKPENVMVRRDGYVKVLDFGLAELRAQAPTTEPGASPAAAIHSLVGAIRGTPGYMSPEQIDGAPPDPGTDIFSLGILLCELTTGANPFARQTIGETFRAIQETPGPAEAVGSKLEPGLAAIVMKALQKERSDRYGAVSELAADLKHQLTELDAATVHGRRFDRSRRYIAASLALTLAAGMAAFLTYRRQERLRWIRQEAMPEIARLVAADRYVPAFRLIQESERELRDDPQLAALARQSTRTASVNSSEPGAQVEVRDYFDADDDWLRLGTTPLEHVRVPGGYLAWRVSRGSTTQTVALPTSETMTFDLGAAWKAPAGMVPVRGQRFLDYLAFFGWLGPYDLPPFFIDRTEVTNRQYQKFVDAGGYTQAQWWAYPFVLDGRELTWEEAMDRLRDTTGRNGPSTWKEGYYREGQADYPVSGVSWFEAAAYAEWAGKSLPVIVQSYVTTPPSLDRYISRLSDASGRLVPVGQSRALGPYGTYDQLGNVREWFWNATPDGKRYTLGRFPSSYGPSAFSPFDRSPINGFRCVLNTKPLVADVVAARPILRRDFAKATPAADQAFRIYENVYAYDHGPLEATVREVPDPSPDWTRQYVTVNAAYGTERLPMYVFLPKHGNPPFQAVLFFPSARVLSLQSSENLGDLSFIDYVIKSGRAVIYPIYQGLYERRNRVPQAGGPVVLRDTIVAWSRDFGRAIDYLESRSDIDRTRLGFLGVSMGSAYGVILASLEKRIKAVVLLDGGFFQIEEPLSGTDQVDFAPRLTQPVLMVNGRYDATYTLEASQLPLFRMLGTPAEDKRHVLLETTHDVRTQRADMTREVLAWWNKYLGPTGTAVP
jgi:dienelactone hydrolase